MGVDIDGEPFFPTLQKFNFDIIFKPDSSTHQTATQEGTLPSFDPSPLGIHQHNLKLMTLSTFIGLLLVCALPGAIGGLMTFVYSYYKGHYQNNQYIIKCSIEIFGGAVVAFFLTNVILSFIVKNDTTMLLVPFAIGLFWAGLIQFIRSWITGIVELALGKADPVAKAKEDRESKSN